MASYIRGFYSDIFGSKMCSSNCSGHGDCLNGTCFCEIKFSGNECGGTNVSYHVGLAATYLIVAIVLFGQLVFAIIKSYRNQMDKGNCFRDALSPTTPKAIYAVMFLAASLRAAYFAVSATWADEWLLSLLTAYYPLLLTGSSLIVCFWAEIFHLRTVCFESHRFLSKSFLGFVTFNVLTYSVLVAQLLLGFANSSETERVYFLNIFNGCYAVLLLVVVVFFLIYGVNVYFKVRGGFLRPNPNRQTQQPSSCPKKDTLALVSGYQVENAEPVDISQLNQSRLGLISQASMLLITILFIVSDVLGGFWKNKVAVESRNYHDIVFRLVEIGVALWFPCVLWNVNRPEQLWILNPNKLLKSGNWRPNIKSGNPTESDDDNDDEDDNDDRPRCFICTGKSTNGIKGPLLIEPCNCRGAGAISHHNCLRTWLQQLVSDGGNLRCGVCKEPYKLVVDSNFRWSSCKDVSSANWLKCCLMCAAMAGISMCTWAASHILPKPAYKLLVIGVGVITLYVLLKFLTKSTIAAYHEARVSTVKIVPQNVTVPGSAVQPTVAETGI